MIPRPTGSSISVLVLAALSVPCNPVFGQKVGALGDVSSQSAKSVATEKVKADAPAVATPPASEAAAHAVPSPPVRPNAFAVRYMMRDMETMAEVLQLDATQASIIEAMLSDYLAETSVSRPVGEYAQLAERFRTNVQAVLSEEQFARWADVDAAVRRSRLALGATLPGEGIDVIGLVKGLIDQKERESREFTAASMEYAAALDPLLARRTELLDAIRANSSRATSAETMRTLADELGPLRASIRDLNMRTAEHVATLLSAEKGASIVDSVRRAAYPSVFSAGEAELFVRRAREDAASNNELRATIDVIAEALESRLADARIRAIEAVRARGELAAGIRGGLSAEQVDERIKQSESELMKVDDWVIDTLVVEMPESTALGAELRQEIDRRDRYRRLREANAWGQPEATLAEFDANGDGQLDAAESDAVFRTYTRNVSRFAKFRL